MSKWQAFKQFMTLNPGPPAVKAFSTSNYTGLPYGDVLGPLGQRNADWSSIRTGERVRDVWAKCATAYACLSLLADAVAESPLRVYQTVNGDLEEDTTSGPAKAARNVIANPNPIMSEAEFMVMTVMTMGLFGYAVTEKVRSGANLPVQLWPLRPDWIAREGRNGTAGFVYRRPGADARPIADEDIILTPYYHDPQHSSVGISPLHIVAREVGIDVALTDLLKVFIDAGGIPPWVVKLSGDVAFDQADADTFREKWKQRYSGSQAYSNIGILNPGMDLHKVGDSIGDMAWPDLRALTELKICQAFRVPADLVQARDSMSSGSLTTTEMEGAMAFLQNHGAQPLRMRIDGSFTRALLPDFTGGDPRYSLEFDTSAIMALQEDRDALHNRVRADWQAGLITLNEARIETSRSDLGRSGEVFLQAFTTSYVSLGDLGAERSSPSILARSEDDSLLALPGRARELTGTLEWSFPRQRMYRNLKALSPADLETRASILTTTRRERDKLTEIGARQLRKFFREQGRRIVGSLPKTASNATVVKATAIDWDEEDDLLRELFDRFYRATGERAFASVAATVGVDIAWDVANPNIARILHELGHRIVGINDTTRQDVIRVITDGQAEGLNLHQISANLTGMFEETYKNRAMTIARTETQVSYNTASQLGYQESGVVQDVEMVDNPDHPEDYGASDGLTCAERHGMIVNIGQMDAHIEAEHPNGSLAFIPILTTPLGEG